MEVDLSKYEPFLVPSRNFPRMLYCALTDDLINRNLKEVKQHIKGKKFLKAKGERAANGTLGSRTCMEELVLLSRPWLGLDSWMMKCNVNHLSELTNLC